MIIPTDGIESATPNKLLRRRLPAFLLILLSSFPSGAQDMDKPSSARSTVDEQCIANLQRIYKLLKLYLHHSGREMGFPTKLDELHLMATDPKPFICPADKQIKSSGETHTFRTSYEIVNDPLKPNLSATPPNKIAIVSEKGPNHDNRRYVLFYDGLVRSFDKAQFDRLKSNSFIDDRDTKQGDGQQ